LIGFLVVAVCVGLIVMLFVPGAGEVADGLGEKCPRTRGGPVVQCKALDVVVVVVFVSPLLLLIGLSLIASPLIARRRRDDRQRPPSRDQLRTG
jgi:hypothetical protein